MNSSREKESKKVKETIIKNTANTKGNNARRINSKSILKFEYLRLLRN
jgi:hypothetical protein